MRVTQGGRDVPTRKLTARFPPIRANLNTALWELPQVSVFENDDLRTRFRLAVVCAWASGEAAGTGSDVATAVVSRSAPFSPSFNFAGCTFCQNPISRRPQVHLSDCCPLAKYGGREQANEDGAAYWQICTWLLDRSSVNREIMITLPRANMSIVQSPLIALDLQIFLCVAGP
jgi:hypothetical protein